MFAGKKSAQIREILISESAWEEMTCLFAPSLICQKGNLAFLRGYRITDKVILPAFRGRSLSARAQRLLYRLLTHSDSELSMYMGTIIPQNIPSMKTAERAGRTCILSYQFLPICRTHD
ncbi:hypothetical protein HJX10_13015 [Klebsiella pneumoniae]|nr:hypothetical protein HJX10_13015 [Klebsiella pneumoniae]